MRHPYKIPTAEEVLKKQQAADLIIRLHRQSFDDWLRAHMAQLADRLAEQFKNKP